MSRFTASLIPIPSSRRTASASSVVRLVVPCDPVRTPLTLRDPASIQTRLSPSLCSSSWARAVAASPMLALVEDGADVQPPSPIEVAP